MKTPFRRSFAVLLSAALLGGLIPPEAARAAAPVRVELGGVSAPAGASAAAGVNAALTLGAPAAALLAPSALSAPSLSAGMSAAAPSAAAPLAAAPAAAAPVAAAAPALSPAVAAAAADGPKAEGPKTPKAAAPAARTGLSRLAGLFRRSAPQEAAKPQAPADEKARSDAAFDGSAPAKGQDEVSVPQGRLARVRSGLKAFALRGVEKYKSYRAVEHDAFGGPKAEPTTFASRVGYGLKWGLNLVGISAIMDWTVAPILSHFAWPLWLSPAALGQFGRVELLTKFGPSTIGAALTHAPIPFLGIALPWSTLMEEFTYRFVGFGVVFGLLALVKPVTAMLAKGLEQIPDASGLRSKVQWALRNGGALVSYFAFPLAALRSSFNFAVAHFATWGVDPYVFALNMVAGYFLARAAYKTRGLTAPFVAHLVFNLAMLGSAIFGATLGMPLAASVYSVVASLVGVGALWYNWRSARKERAFKLKSLAGGAKALMIAGLVSALSFGALNSGVERGAMTAAAYKSVTVGQIVAKDTAKNKMEPATDITTPVEPLAGALSAADTAKAEAPQDMIARVRPSVVKIIVKMPQGYALGSGVIVTPEGRIVTNAHVVGPKQVGEVVMVEIASGQKVPAKIVAVNHDRDQAYLQLPQMRNKKTGEIVAWPMSRFAQTAPRVGDDVYAMGHPLGLPFTVTKGIVSGLGARGNMYLQYLQTDASITHGNSGGPLYNAKGEVLGINTMGPENAGNIGFSITAPSVVRGLIQFDAVGNINTAALGVITDLSNPDQPEMGVAVELVRPGSAAAKAGIKPGDVIVGAAGQPLEAEGGKASVHDLSAILAQAKPGDTIELAVVRGDAVQIVKITLDAKKTSEETSAAHGFDGEDQP